jgi:hypothetical protein
MMCSSAISGQSIMRGQPSVTGGRLTAEVATGVLAMPVGFFGGGLATRWVARKLGADDEHAADIATAGAYTGAALLTALPPTLIGQAGPHATGSYLAALGGSAVGGLGSWALVRLNKKGTNGDTDRPCHVACVLSTAAIFLLPSAGATVGFNLSRRYAGRPPH